MTVASQLFQDLPTISLTQLQEEAELLTRVDRKYLLGPEQLTELADRLPSGCQVLSIAGSQLLGYESLYFDTPDLDCFYRTAYGRPHRFKVRTRTYLDSSETWLELKTRSRRGETEKFRHQIAPQDHHSLPPSSRDILTPPLTNYGVGNEIVSQLKPVVTTAYRRTTLLEPSTDSRVTIDFDLGWNAQNGARATMNAIVVETKSALRIGPVDQLLWRMGIRPVSFSKYAFGMAVCHQDLPTNRWHRLLPLARFDF